MGFSGKRHLQNIDASKKHAFVVVVVVVVVVFLEWPLWDAFSACFWLVAGRLPLHPQRMAAIYWPQHKGQLIRSGVDVFILID